jgi:peptidoglycan/LPS O-acetylase OafA/YrhL
LARRFRRDHYRTALAVATLGQVLLTFGGSLFPDQVGVYGAPFPVGQSCGSNLLFGCPPSFFFPLWVLNVLVTAAICLVMAALLNGRMRAGLITVAVAVAVAYAVVILRFNLDPLQDLRSIPMLVWAWTLVALAAVWGFRLRASSLRSRRPGPERVVAESPRGR